MHQALAAAFLTFAVSGTDAQEITIRKSLNKNLPDLAEIKSVTKLPIKHLYEVVLEGKILYVDSNGSYLLDGHLIDIKNGRSNLTTSRLSVLNKVVIHDLPLELAIQRKIGDGSRKLVIFADPNCVYCKKLESESLSDLRDVTIYTFVYPILGASSKELAHAISCTEDKVHAWNSWMVDGTKPVASTEACGAKQVKLIEDLGKSLKIVGTPTLIFQDGTRVSGAMSREEIESVMDRMPKNIRE